MAKLFGLLILVFAVGCDQSPSTLASGGQIVLRGERPQSEYGASGDLVGDLNADGFGDVVIGAPGDSRNGNNAGAVYVYFGSSSGISETPDAVLLGGAGDRFGSSLRGVGDVNQDGIDDLAIGALSSSRQGFSNQSVVHFFWGRRAGLLTTAEEVSEGVRYSEVSDLTLINDITQELPMVSAAGDLNQDGRLDVAVGLPQGDRVVVFLGGSAFPTAPLFSFSQANLHFIGKEGDSFGASLAAVGDVNGFNQGSDTRFGDDLLIGAPHAEGGGKAFLVLGHSGLSGTKAIDEVSSVFSGDREGDFFGASVAGIGDFDADGFGDLAIGAPGNGAGYVEVYFGQSQSGPLSTRLPLKILGEMEGDGFGTAISGSIEATLLGVSALYVAAPNSNFVHEGGGLFYQFTQALYPGDTSGSGITLQASAADQRFQNLVGGSGQNSSFGFVLASGLDVTGDGNGDVLVGAPYSNTAGEDAGQAILYW